MGLYGLGRLLEQIEIFGVLFYHTYNIFVAVLVIEPRDLHMFGKYCISELKPQPFKILSQKMKASHVLTREAFL